MATYLHFAQRSLGVVAPCNPQALALARELQAVLDALQSPARDAPWNPSRAGRDQRRLASRVFLLNLRLHWIMSALRAQSSGSVPVFFSSFRHTLERTPLTPGNCASVPSRKSDRAFKSRATTLHT